MSMPNQQKVLQSLNPNRIVLPVFIGLGAVIYLLLSKDNFDFNEILGNLKKAKSVWIFSAFVVLLIRDLGYMYRIRHLTEQGLGWTASFYVIILWEFASAVTPSIVGGTAAAIFILNREKISMGKSMAYVMLTAMFDNMFFIITSLLIILLIPFQIFPTATNTFTLLSMAMTLKSVFIFSVTIVLAYTFIMFYGLFINPRGFKWLLIKLSSNKLMRRWKSSAARNGDEVIIASAIIRKKQFDYWLKAAVSTLFIWLSRYFMLNCIVAAFTGLNLSEHLLIMCRQVVMWVVMLASPTPGSTGTAELTFDLFFSEFFSVAGLSLVVALFWRLFTYYAYLIVGVVVFPRWLRRALIKQKKHKLAVN